MGVEGKIAELSIAERAAAVKQFNLREMLAQPPIESRPGQDARPEPQRPPAGVSGGAESEESLPPPDELSPLPGPGAPYVAAARAANKPLPSLVLLLADASAMGFGYASLDTFCLLPGGPGQGPEIVLRFAGIAAQEVRIAGRHLDRLFSMLGQHRVAWLRERSPERDFLPESDTVITAIRIATVRQEA